MQRPSNHMGITQKKSKFGILPISYPEPSFPGRARNWNGCQPCPQKKAVSKPDES